MIPTSFNQTTEYKRGEFGEDIVLKYLEEKGYVVYKPKTENRAHIFDNLVMKDKQNIFIVEVKTKARRKYYADTGIPYRHYTEYKYIMDKHNIDIFLFFVDELTGTIYGNTLLNLDKKENNYPKREGNIYYFDLKKMKHIHKLSETDVLFLKKNTTRNYDYEVV